MPAQSNDSYAGNVHLAGEFFVAAELAKRGYAVSLTLGPAKAIDICAERGGRILGVQVKAIRRGTHGWPMPHDPAKIIDGVPFVLVSLNEEHEPVDYFILTAKQVRAAIQRYDTRAVIRMGKAKPGRSAWRVIDDAMKARR